MGTLHAFAGAIHLLSPQSQVVYAKRAQNMKSNNIDKKSSIYCQNFISQTENFLKMKKFLLLNFLLASVVKPILSAGGTHEGETSENQNLIVGLDGPAKIIYYVPNNPAELPLTVHRVQFNKHPTDLQFYSQRTECHADYVKAKSTPAYLVFSLDLKKCNPPLKSPEDLIGMQLGFSFSIGAGPPKVEAIPLNYDDEELDIYKSLFVGGVELVVPLEGHGVESAMDLLFEKPSSSVQRHGVGENSGHGMAGSKGITKIQFINLLDYQNGRRDKVTLHYHSFGKKGVYCPVRMDPSQFKMPAFLNLKYCYPPLERAEQLRGMVLEVECTIGVQTKFVEYKMEEALSEEELQQFFEGGVFYELKKRDGYRAEYWKLFVNQNGFAIPAVGSHGRGKNLEGQTAGMNGPMEIVYTRLINPNNIKVDMHEYNVWQTLEFFNSDKTMTRVCSAVEFVKEKSTNTKLTFSVDLRSCEPKLKDPLDLAELNLTFKYSWDVPGFTSKYLSGNKHTVTLPSVDVPGFGEKYKMLFAGNAQILIPEYEVVQLIVN